VPTTATATRATAARVSARSSQAGLCPTPDTRASRSGSAANGVVDPGETCDDGKHPVGDGCSSTCQAEPGWQCPGASTDGGARPVGACIQIKCGDGVGETGEGCDDGNNASRDGCSATCQIEKGCSVRRRARPCTASQCGDRRRGGQRAVATTATPCRRTAVAPRARWRRAGSAPRRTPSASRSSAATASSPQRACDDGNNLPNDGCSPTCQLEAGFACTTKPAPPQSVCHKTVLRRRVKEASRSRRRQPHPVRRLFADVHHRASLQRRDVHGRLR